MRAHTAQSARLLSTLTLLSRRLVAALPSLAGASSAVALMDEESHEPVGPAEFWAKLGLSAGLVLLGGVFAGLTLGLMGLDELHLRVLSASSENPKERSNAVKGLLSSHKWKHVADMNDSAAAPREEAALGACGELFVWPRPETRSELCLGPAAR
jgi:hypothetical protein